VIAVDTNVLIYANRAELPLHVIARTRLTELAKGASRGIAGGRRMGFLRIVTQPIFDLPTPIGQAIEFVQRLLGSPTVRVLTSDRGTGNCSAQYSATARCEEGSSLTPASLRYAESTASAHYYQTTRDFRRFPDIRLLRLDS
jgi:uncharacterized protein